MLAFFLVVVIADDLSLPVFIVSFLLWVLSRLEDEFREVFRNLHGIADSIQGVSSIRRVFKQLLSGIFKTRFSLVFVKLWSEFCKAAFGCIVQWAGFYQPLRNTGLS